MLTVSSFVSATGIGEATMTHTADASAQTAWTGLVWTPSWGDATTNSAEITNLGATFAFDQTITATLLKLTGAATTFTKSAGVAPDEVTLSVSQWDFSGITGVTRVDFPLVGQVTPATDFAFQSIDGTLLANGATLRPIQANALNTGTIGLGTALTTLDSGSAPNNAIFPVVAVSGTGDLALHAHGTTGDDGAGNQAYAQIKDLSAMTGSLNLKAGLALITPATVFPTATNNVTLNFDGGGISTGSASTTIATPITVTATGGYIRIHNESGNTCTLSGRLTSEVGATLKHVDAGRLTISGDASAFYGTFASRVTGARGSFNFNTTVGSSHIFPGNIDLPRGAPATLNINSDLALSGLISGSGAVTKAGTKTLFLAAPQTHTTSTTVTSGMLKLPLNQHLSSPVTINTGATISFTPATVGEMKFLGGGVDGIYNTYKDAMLTSEGAIPVGDMSFMHTSFGNDIPFAIYEYEGTFDVATAGTYTFAGTWDDALTFTLKDNSGTEIGSLSTSPTGNYWQSVGIGTFTNLAVGSYRFTVRFTNNIGGIGPSTDTTNWADKKMALGWTAGTSTSTDANDYTKFEVGMGGAIHNIKLTPRNGIYGTLLSKSAGIDAYNNYATEILTTKTIVSDMTMLHKPTNFVTNYTTCEYSGTFEVNSDGYYAFAGTWDDAILFKVNGEELFDTKKESNTSWSFVGKGKTKTELIANTEYTFVVRFANNTGGIGPGAWGAGDGKALGWRKTTAEEVLTDATDDYTKFDVGITATDGIGISNIKLTFDPTPPTLTVKNGATIDISTLNETLQLTSLGNVPGAVITLKVTEENLKHQPLITWQGEAPTRTNFVLSFVDGFDNTTTLYTPIVSDTGIYVPMSSYKADAQSQTTWQGLVWDNGTPLPLTNGKTNNAEILNLGTAFAFDETLEASSLTFLGNATAFTLNNGVSLDVTKWDFTGITGASSVDFPIGGKILSGDDLTLNQVKTNSILTIQTGDNVTLATQNADTVINVHNAGKLTSNGAILSPMTESAFSSGELVLNADTTTIDAATTTFSSNGAHLVIQKITGDSNLIVKMKDGSVDASGSGNLNYCEFQDASSIINGTLTITRGLVYAPDSTKLPQGEIILAGGGFCAKQERITIPNPVTVSGNGYVRCYTSTEVEYACIFAGPLTGDANARLTLVNGGALIVSGNASAYLGTIDVTATGDWRNIQFNPTVPYTFKGNVARTNSAYTYFMIDTDKDLTFEGRITGSGNVVKRNPGMLTFTQAQTYTSNTDIEAGTLKMPATATTKSIVSSGATLALTTVGPANVELQSGSTLDISTLTEPLPLTAIPFVANTATTIKVNATTIAAGQKLLVTWPTVAVIPEGISITLSGTTSFAVVVTDTGIEVADSVVDEAGNALAEGPAKDYIIKEAKLNNSSITKVIISQDNANKAYLLNVIPSFTVVGTTSTAALDCSFLVSELTVEKDENGNDEIVATAKIVITTGAEGIGGIKGKLQLIAASTLTGPFEKVAENTTTEEGQPKSLTLRAPIVKGKPFYKMRVVE